MELSTKPNVVLLNHVGNREDDGDAYFWHYTCYLLVNLKPKKVEFTSYVELKNQTEILNKANEQLRPTNSGFQFSLGAQNEASAI